MAKFFKLLILVPIAIVVLALAIANRQMVSVSFDPFSAPETSSAFVSAPLFLLLFLFLMIGVIIGGIATWFTQGTNRRRARVAKNDAERWRDEALRLRDQPVPVLSSGRALARTDY